MPKVIPFTYASFGTYTEIWFFAQNLKRPSKYRRIKSSTAFCTFWGREFQVAY